MPQRKAVCIGQDGEITDRKLHDISTFLSSFDKNSIL
jgi:hypothetical protein